MKIITVLLFSGCLTASAEGSSQKVTLSQKNVKLEKVFREIRKQTGYVFFYDARVLQDAKTVSIHVKNADVEDALKETLEGQPLDFSIERKTITIVQKAATAQPIVNTLPPATMSIITGTVRDEGKDPLTGVSVVVKGTNKGTSTNADGSFSIDANVGDVLEFSFVGYKNRSVTVSQSSSLSIVMEIEATIGDEVVVVGYGTQKKMNVTGAVGSISTKDFENQPISGLDQAMKGQVAGVQVSQTTGTPGGGLTVRVRGTGSIGAGNEPLYVIDGFPVSGSYDQTTNPLTSINPNDIASIEILKDASSAAIYGSRGANGVVIITTKRGKAGKTQLRFETFLGMQEVAHKIDMLNAREYAEYNTELRNNRWVDMGGNASDPNSVRDENVQIPPMFANPSFLGKGTDWQDEIFQVAPIENYQLTGSGGNDKTQYFVSGGYYKQDGIVIHTGFERYSVRLNLDTKLYDKLKLGVSFAPSFQKNRLRPVEGQVFGNGILATALAMPPTVPVRNPDGSFTSLMPPSPYALGNIENPVAIAEKEVANRSAFRSLGTVYAELSLRDDLKLRTSLGADFTSSINSSFHPSDLGSEGAEAPTQASGSAGNDMGLTWLNENTLTFDRAINDVHNINAIVGLTSQKSRYDAQSLYATNFPNNIVTTLNAGQVTSGGTYISEWALLSYLGRVNYDYKNKYLLSATIRRDGSSRFGSSRKWGTFPSASIGWDVAKEKFFQKQKRFGYFKFRASYGLTGNNDIGNYNQIGFLAPRNYVFGNNGGTVTNGLYPASISNKDLGWEISKQLDIGLDISFLRNRIDLTIDYYNKNTSDLLLDVPVPASTGFTSALENIGKVNNRGWEFTINTRNIVSEFKWTTSFNISINKNKIIALGPSGAPIRTRTGGITPPTNISKIGSPLGLFWGYEVIGIYQTQEEIDKSAAFPTTKPGDLKFKDVNGDKIISSDDMTTIGNPHPDFTYGMSNNFSYKNFSLSVLIDGVQGMDRLNGARRNIMFVSGSYSRRDVLGRWQSPESPGDGKNPRGTTAGGKGNVSLISSFLVEDASFLRIRNINLGYQLPEKLFKTKLFRSANLYVNVQNAFTFTKYKGFNPEQSINGASPLSPGVDFNGYPIARIYTAGINVVF
ncbi:MAG: TonB-dependent receptor [Ginsengibacter sp.]